MLSAAASAVFLQGEAPTSNYHPVKSSTSDWDVVSKFMCEAFTCPRERQHTGRDRNGDSNAIRELELEINRRLITPWSRVNLKRGVIATRQWRATFVLKCALELVKHNQCSMPQKNLFCCAWAKTTKTGPVWILRWNRCRLIKSLDKVRRPSWCNMKLEIDAFSLDIKLQCACWFVLSS